MEKIDFENFVSDFLVKIAKSYWFSIGFPIDFLLKINRISNILIKKIRDKIFKINFLHEEKKSSNFFYDLEFSYTIDLAHYEHPRRCFRNPAPNYIKVFFYYAQ